MAIDWVSSKKKALSAQKMKHLEEQLSLAEKKAYLLKETLKKVEPSYAKKKIPYKPFKEETAQHMKKKYASGGVIPSSSGPKNDVMHFSAGTHSVNSVYIDGKKIEGASFEGIKFSSDNVTYDEVWSQPVVTNYATTTSLSFDNNSINYDAITTLFGLKPKFVAKPGENCLF